MAPCDDDHAREREWVERTADELIAERRPSEPPATPRRRELARAMVLLRAGRPEIPPPSAELARRVEASIEAAREAAEAGSPPDAGGREKGEGAGAGGAGREGTGGITRREVLRWVGVSAVAATALSIGADRLIGLVAGRGGKAEQGRWREVAASASLAEGGVLFRDVEGTSLFLLREGGKVRALSAVCTHMACVLRLDEARREFVCPCHGATFDLDGRSIASGYRAPLPPLPELAAREEDGRIYVWIA